MSLKSFIQKGRFYFNWQEPTPEAYWKYTQLIGYVTNALGSRDTILVNAQSVWDDVTPSKNNDSAAAWIRAVTFHEIPRPKPPFETMWLEAITTLDAAQQRTGVLVGVSRQMETWMRT
jgi:hypothetical protein